MWTVFVLWVIAVVLIVLFFMGAKKMRGEG